MFRLCLFFFTILTISCSITKTNHYDINNNQNYVSCPPHLIYCYRKSDLICRSEYRVLSVRIEEKPNMLIKCNQK